MANTYELISSYTAGGTITGIAFTSIPNTYTDLCLVLSARADIATAAVKVEFNGSAASFSAKVLYGNGSSANSVNSTTYVIIGGTNEGTATSNTFANASFYIPNYAGISYKSFSIDGVSENNSTTAYAGMGAGLWSNTAAITQIAIKPNTDNFVQYTTAYLYGVKNA